MRFSTRCPVGTAIEALVAVEGRRWAIEDALERDKFLTADMARDFGIVDKVIDKRAEEAAPTKTP